MGGSRTQHEAGVLAGSAPATGTRRGWLLIATAALTLLTTMLPAGPAAAAPVATTTAASVTWGRFAESYELTADVTRPDGVPPAGIMVFSRDGVEIGRARLTPLAAAGRGYLVTAAAPGSHTYTAAYLGDAASGPSTGSTTMSAAQVTRSSKVTGSIQVGSQTLVVGPDNNFASSFSTPGTYYYNPDSGLIDTGSATSYFVDLPRTGDVTGVGAVTLQVRPVWTTLTGSVSPTGIVRLTPASPVLQIDRITVDGETWAGGSCSMAIGPLTLVGTAGPAGLAVTASAPAPAALPPSACDGRAALVNALIDRPVAFDLLLDGTYPPPSDNVPTTTTVGFYPTTPTLGGKVTLNAVVTAAGGRPVPGVVEFRDNGVAVGRANTTSSGAWLELFIYDPGPHTFTADYLGVTTPDATPLLPSSGATNLTMPDAPPGRQATGQFTLTGRATVALGASTRLTGAAFDPATGTIGPGAFWLPPGQFTTPISGYPIGINYQLTQLAPITGQVDPDGTVTFTQASFRLDGHDFHIFAWNALDCPFEPVTMTLTGRADATGLHLTGHATIPPTTGTCAGYAGAANALFTPGAEFVFDVAGDFRRSDATPVQVTSWYPTVDQHNQTYLSAAVTPTDATTPTGTITFRDDTTVLGTAPLDPTGHAHLPVTLDQAGPRTITADYTGDHHPGWGATTIDVTPAPVGYALDGHITLGAATLPIGAGSQLLLATPPTAGDAAGAVAAGLTHQTASLWFMPTTITTDLPGYGPVTAEVRLNQYQTLSPATIDPGGTIDDLNGMFVLHIRKLTTTTGTTTPLGCVNLVLIAFDGRLTTTDVDLTTTNAGTGRIPWGTCTGPAQALADQLTATPTATLHATL